MTLFRQDFGTSHNVPLKIILERKSWEKAAWIFYSAKIMFHNRIYFNASFAGKNFFCLCFLIFSTLKVIKISSEFSKWNYLRKAIPLLLFDLLIQSVFVLAFCGVHDSLSHWSCKSREFRFCSISRYQPCSLGKWRKRKNRKSSKNQMRHIMRFRFYLFSFDARV